MENDENILYRFEQNTTRVIADSWSPFTNRLVEPRLSRGYNRSQRNTWHAIVTSISRQLVLGATETGRLRRRRSHAFEGWRDWTLLNRTTITGLPSHFWLRYLPFSQLNLECLGQIERVVHFCLNTHRRSSSRSRNSCNDQLTCG